MFNIDLLEEVRKHSTNGWHIESKLVNHLRGLQVHRQAPLDYGLKAKINEVLQKQEAIVMVQTKAIANQKLVLYYICSDLLLKLALNNLSPTSKAIQHVAVGLWSLSWFGSAR